MKYIHKSGPPLQLQKFIRILKLCDCFYDFIKEHKRLHSKYSFYPSNPSKFILTYAPKTLICWYARGDNKLHIKLTQTYNEIYKTK